MEFVYTTFLNHMFKAASIDCDFGSKSHHDNLKETYMLIFRFIIVIWGTTRIGY